MLAVLKLEFIGENYHAYKRQKTASNSNMERYSGYLGRDQSRPWVALLTGIDQEKMQLVRKFVDGQIDYSGANRVGSRGVCIYYPLKDGLYEVNARETWTQVKRYFIRVQDAQITEISRVEVWQCLQNNLSV